MDRDARAALATACRDIGAALTRLAAELETPGAVNSAGYGPANMRLPWSERVLRQSLILDDIANEPGGWVTKERWYEIAARYGYSGRGLAGSFREEGNGLLEMRPNGRIYVTKHGKERLAQNLGRVRTARQAEA